MFVGTLAEGAQASAQLVLHVQTGEFRVRKVFINNFLSDPTTTADKHEAKTLQLLQAKASEIGASPNIVTIHDSSPGVLYLGFCNGGDLSRLPRDAPASVIYRVVAQATRSIAFMHQHGVSHNDLHAGNVFVHFPEEADFPELFVGDFGISASQSEPVVEPTSDVYFPLEMLEQLQESSEELDVSSDLQQLIDEANSLLPPMSVDEAASVCITGGRWTRLLHLAEEASAKNPMCIEDLQFLPRRNSPNITYYDSVEAFLKMDIELEGPFQMAEVRVDSNNVFQELLHIDDEMRIL